MKHLSLKAVEFLKGVYRLQSTAELSEWIVRGLADLFHAENAIVCRHDGVSRVITAIVAKHPFGCANLMPHINESGIMSLHPFWDTTFCPERVVRPLSAVASKASWHANPLYNEVFRPDGIEDQLNTEVLGDSREFTTINVLRSRRGFTQTEIQLLTILREHISQALSNARRLEEACVVGPTVGQSILIPLDWHGSPNINGTHTADVLAEVFPFRGRLPAVVRDWVSASVRLLNEGCTTAKIAPFVFCWGNRRWEFCIHRDMFNGGYMLSMIADGSENRRNVLSKREGEVMSWVEKGKTNEEIADILEVSVNTVKTHLKRSFVKLGVENRTSAISAIKSQERHFI